ncbi:MAG: SurA N-terminal domain-containing protein [Oleiphilaceae bacterium]|nr:SurA N-terminal domain-containing protein [Oleiphilaceae bacterium]
MLQDVRQGMQGTTAKVIVWAIAITFALFGAESIVGGISGEPEVAEVNGEGIPESAFQIAVERKKRQLLMQMGDAADPDLIDDGLLGQSVLDGMIQEKILEQDASDKGLFISVQMVDEYIRNMSEFQIDGQFSNERMQSVLGSAGFSLNTFRESLAKQFVLDQSRSAFLGSSFVLDAEEESLLKLDRQTRDFGMAVLDSSQFLDQVSVSDSDVASYYESNQELFKKPESVDVSYVVLRQSELTDVEVTSEEIEARYDQEIQDFVGEEERNASHILIAITEELDESSALAKAQELKARIDAGEDFAEIAKQESADEGSAENGGELGYSAKGVYVSGFEDALFALEEGAVSEPVKTEFGYHVIKLLDIQVNEPPALADRALVIEEEIKQEKLSNLYVDLSQQLADISYSAPDLIDPSEELGLEINQLAGVSRLTQDAVFSNVKVQRALFNEENLSGENNSELIELEEGVAVVFKVEDYHPESIKPLDQVSDQVVSQLESEKSRDYAASIGKAFVDRVEAGEKAEAVAADMELDWQLKTDVRRDNAFVDASLLFKVFAMQKPDDGESTVAGFDLNSGEFALVALTSANEGDLSDITIIEKQGIKGSLGASYGGTDYAAYMMSVESSAEVEKL